MEKHKTLRNIIRKAIEEIFVDEAKKKKRKKNKTYGIPVFSRGFFPYYGSSNDSREVGMDIGGDSGGGGDGGGGE